MPEELAPEETPETTPETTPEATPETTPETTPEETPETKSGLLSATKEEGEKEGEKSGNKEEKEEKPGNKEGEKEEKSNAPEKYADFTMPENMEMSPEMQEAFPAIAKEFDLSQDDAQKLMDLHTGVVQKMVEDQMADWEKTQEDWKTEITGHKTLGGKNLQDSVKTARTFLDAYAVIDPKLDQMLEDTGHVNNPAMFALFSWLGEQVKDDSIKLGDGQGSGGVELSLAERLFPDQKE